VKRCFLRSVLGEARIAQYPTAEGKEHGAMPADEGGERFPIALPGFLD